MELIIDLKLDCLHLKDMSVYDHNIYFLRSALFGCDHIKVNYSEVANQYDVAIGEDKEGVFVGQYFFDASVTDQGSRLVVYLN